VGVYVRNINVPSHHAALHTFQPVSLVTQQSKTEDAAGSLARKERAAHGFTVGSSADVKSGLMRV
jgi:hypothetical protein